VTSSCYSIYIIMAGDTWEKPATSLGGWIKTGTSGGFVGKNCERVLRIQKHLGYGLMNEPNNMLDSMPWARIAQASILAIRKYDAKNSIVVGGDSWSSAERWMQYGDNLKYLYDPADNLIFEAHVYFDEDASGTYKKSYEEEKANPIQRH